MKIYTRAGDRGETGLIGGLRVPKDHPRVEAYGAIDEANAILGVVLNRLREPDLAEILAEVQRDLFVIGALLATPPESRSRKSVEAIDESRITQLERWIDAADQELPPLRNFVLPGGTEAAALLHQARTVVRRAERRCVGIVEGAGSDGSALRYLNRLSDFLFVMARLVNRRGGAGDRIWTPEE